MSLFFANKVFEKKPPPPQRNSKYMKQCSLFVIVPKSFLKVQIGNFKILVCNIKFFLKYPFFSVWAGVMICKTTLYPSLGMGPEREHMSAGGGGQGPR